MIIDWSTTAVYNTIMSVATGISLLLIVKFFLDLKANKIHHLDGWVVGFAVPGVILTLTGLHMSLTWPLSKIGFPFDDIIFGEPSLAFGLLLLGFSFILYRQGNRLDRTDINTPDLISEKLKLDLPSLLKPSSYFAAAMGYALFAIAIAGVTYQLFAAPPEEPISGYFANYPLMEAIFISALYAVTGLGAALLPFALKDKPNMRTFTIIKFAFIISGVIFVAFGVMNYFTHIGLIVNTM